MEPRQDANPQTLDDRMRRIERRIQQYSKLPNDAVPSERQQDWQRKMTETEAGYQRWKSLPTDIRHESELEEIENVFNQTLSDFDIKDDDTQPYDDSTSGAREYAAAQGKDAGPRNDTA